MLRSSKEVIKKTPQPEESLSFKIPKSLVGKQIYTCDIQSLFNVEVTAECACTQSECNFKVKPIDLFWSADLKLNIGDGNTIYRSYKRDRDYSGSCTGSSFSGCDNWEKRKEEVIDSKETIHKLKVNRWIERYAQREKEKTCEISEQINAEVTTECACTKTECLVGITPTYDKWDVELKISTKDKKPKFYRLHSKRK